MQIQWHSLVKAVSWRIWATLATLTIVYALTRSIRLTTSITLLEIFIKIALYYAHERVWSRYKRSV